MKKLVSLAVLSALVTGCMNGSSSDYAGYGYDGMEKNN